MQRNPLPCAAAMLGVALSLTAGAAPQPGDSSQSITVAGVQRTYVLHLPPHAGSQALPLVLVLHGHGGNGAGMEHLTGLGAKADAERFIAVFPDALGQVDGRPAWNSGSRADPGLKYDDVAFLRELLDKLEHDLLVDPKRVYACGFSNGGFMTYRLAAELSGRLAAIGVASGSIGARPPGEPERIIPEPSHPVSVIHFHGKKDPVVSYAGTGGHDGSLPTYAISVAESIGFWVQHDGCSSPPHQTTSHHGNLVKDDYASCRGTHEVVLYSFGKGTHEWPQPTNNDRFSATDALWEFFSRHARP